MNKTGFGGDGSGTVETDKDSRLPCAPPSPLDQWVPTIWKCNWSFLQRPSAAHKQGSGADLLISQLSDAETSFVLSAQALAPSETAWVFFWYRGLGKFNPSKPCKFLANTQFYTENNERGRVVKSRAGCWAYIPAQTYPYVILANKVEVIRLVWDKQSPVPLWLPAL